MAPDPSPDACRAGSHTMALLRLRRPLLLLMAVLTLMLLRLAGVGGGVGGGGGDGVVGTWLVLQVGHLLSL